MTKFVLENAFVRLFLGTDFNFFHRFKATDAKLELNSKKHLIQIWKPPVMPFH